MIVPSLPLSTGAMEFPVCTAESQGPAAGAAPKPHAQAVPSIPGSCEHSQLMASTRQAHSKRTAQQAHSTANTRVSAEGQLWDGLG